jgi:predicted phosphodiesterase
MRIHLLSDLHLELKTRTIDFKEQNVQNKADILILAGDIGSPYKENYNELLANVSGIYEKVIIITGNHEYYGKHTMHKVEEKIRDLCSKYNNVHFLQKEVFIYKRIRFVGCTLWSKGDQSLCKYMSDFKYMPTMSHEKYVSLYNDHKSWLEEVLPLKSDEYDNTFVITHHLPLKALICDEYKDHYLNDFFASDISTDGANFWCYGHTHTPNFDIINNIKFYCNPYGYTYEKVGYNPNLIIEIE